MQEHAAKGHGREPVGQSLIWGAQRLAHEHTRRGAFGRAFRQQCLRHLHLAGCIIEEEALQAIQCSAARSKALKNGGGSSRGR